MCVYVCACVRERERSGSRGMRRTGDERKREAQERFGGGFRCEGLGRPMESPEG